MFNSPISMYCIMPKRTNEAHRQCQPIMERIWQSILKNNCNNLLRILKKEHSAMLASRKFSCKWSITAIFLSIDRHLQYENKIPWWELYSVTKQLNIRAIRKCQLIREIAAKNTVILWRGETRLHYSQHL